MSVRCIATPRLQLLALSATAREALQSCSPARSPLLRGLRFPSPFALPPGLHFAPSDELGWGPWLFSAPSERQVLGWAGFSGPPTQGLAHLSASLYPDCLGRGWATEAARALLHWAEQQPGCHRIQARVPANQEKALALARRLGMRELGRLREVGRGEVVVLQRELDTQRVSARPGATRWPPRLA